MIFIKKYASQKNEITASLWKSPITSLAFQLKDEVKWQSNFQLLITMKSLADTTGLLETTISMLMGSQEPVTAQAGVALIDQWILPLSESENTQPIAQELQKLKGLLISDPTDSAVVTNQMKVIAEKVLMIAPDIGAEGEMPSLLSSLATALRTGTGSPQEQ
ncbi:hypothetical protein MUK70_14390 [Dyadobacter chenwenxiniae]|uniref:Uncharacterized protein n=1 Tax=Dyadobacter chenwenxiniae TaxID=2906456 RepID=A0A9X1TDJ5_9BACT|nr:hypothetical protein [Dyadobacter chenwenxiniae]MCF0060430.1 hypothetical protein [Dyadobacter chenwenxiniae]UON86161.1 hypothetical protein MUK70_14390 [Dyadobacter chenwenxiniae]